MHLEEYQLSERELKKLAKHLQIEWIERDCSIPQTFIPSISLEHEGIKYTNPTDPKEFTIFCSSKSAFGARCVLKHTKNGYQDPSYFTHFVPSLAIVKSNYQEALKPITQKVERLPAQKKDEIIRNIAQQHINSPLNREYKNNGMKLTELQIIHLFFNLYMPGIDGICPKCFKLSLPIEGFGARWLSQDNNEIRLSIPKINSRYDAHKVLYATHTFKRNGKKLHVAFEGIHYVQRADCKINRIESQLKVIEPINIQLFSEDTHKKPERIPSVHIPYDIYNHYLGIIQYFPYISNQEFLICQCQK
jgi:hypothetical protein